MAKIDRPTIVAGNDTTLYIQLKEYRDGEYVDFDLTQVSDLKVELLCARDNYRYEIPYKIDPTYTNLIICDLKYTYYHTNTSYGIIVTGTNPDEKHWTWCMMPREGFLVVSNTSGLHLTDEAQQLSFNGLVGWGISTDADLTNYYTKIEVNELLDQKVDESELTDDYYDSETIDELLEAKADTSDLATVATTGDYNDLINKPVIPEQVQSDWNETDASKLDYIKNKPDLSQYATEQELNNYYNKGQVDGMLNNKVDTSTLNSDYYNKNTVNNLLDAKADTSDLAPVATSGSYNDLSNKPDLTQYATHSELNAKQDTLVSGQNIKTINNISLLGSGNIDIQGGTQVQADWTETDTTADSYIQHKPDLTQYATHTELSDYVTQTALDGELADYYDSDTVDGLLDDKADVSDLNDKQDTLVSGTNIKTINNQSLLGSGNIDIQSGDKPYEEQYLTFENIEEAGNTFSFTSNDLQYSYDGITWNTLTAGTGVVAVTAGSKIMFKQTGLTPASNAGIGTFSATKKFKVYGNIMSLYYGDNFVGQTNLTGKDYAFYNLFNRCSNLISAENLILPATTLSQHCYTYMFHDCTSMTIAPALPATTLVNYCYYHMFERCSSLKAAPELPATTLTNYCYNYMFYNCSSLNYIKCLATSINALNCTQLWVKGVAATGIFITPDNPPAWTTGTSGIPTGWTSCTETEYDVVRHYELSNVATSGNYNDLSNKPDLSTKQDTLVSGQNIKTINNQSLLGSGNIDIQGGGGSYTAGKNIDITNNVISTTDDIDAGTITAEDIKIKDTESGTVHYARWADTANRYLADQALAGTEMRIGDQWYTYGNNGTLYVDTQNDGLITISYTEWTYTDVIPSWIPDYITGAYKSTTTVNGYPVYGAYNPDSDSPDFFIYDADNYGINSLWVDYNDIPSEKPLTYWHIKDKGMYVDTNNTTDATFAADRQISIGANNAFGYGGNVVMIGDELKGEYTGNQLIVGKYNKEKNALFTVANGQSDSTFWAYSTSIDNDYTFTMWTELPEEFFNESGNVSIRVITMNPEWTELFACGPYLSFWHLNESDPYSENMELEYQGTTYYTIITMHRESNNLCVTFELYTDDQHTTPYNIFASPAEVDMATVWIPLPYRRDAFFVTESGDVYMPYFQDKNNTFNLGETIYNLEQRPQAVQSDWNEGDSSSLAYIQNKPTITQPVQSDWNESDSSSLAYIQNKPTISQPVQSDWNQVDSGALDYIKNKPAIPDPYVNDTNPMYQYFTITCLTAGTFTCQARSGLSLTLYYKMDSGNAWNTWNINSWSTSAINLIADHKYYFKGTKAGLSNTVYNTQFGGTAQIELSGNLLSLLYGDEFIRMINTTINNGTAALRRIFYYHTGITSAKNLVIPIGVYQNRVFEQMFMNCTNLEYGPQLLFTNEDSYTDSCKEMFSGCTSLKYLKCTLLTNTAPTAFTNWLQNVSATGTFVKSDNMTQWTLDSASGIPTGWTILNESDLEPSLKYETVTSTTNGLKIDVVAALPATPDSNTIYIIA